MDFKGLSMFEDKHKQSEKVIQKVKDEEK